MNIQHRIRPAAILLLALVVMTIFPVILPAEELEMINRPVNLTGLTGLLFTVAPFTVPPKTFELGMAVMTERSYDPDYTVTSYPVTLSYGLNPTTELALRTAYWAANEAQQTKTRGRGDSEIALKWNLLPPREYSSRPSVAAMIAGIAPTGNRQRGTNSVKNWGCRFGLSVGSEILIEDYVMGVYADGQITVQDLSSELHRDWYHAANAGILLPISKYRNLQMFFEYNRQNGKDVVTLLNEDFSGVTYGLRLVGERFNLTIGTQFVRKENESRDNSSRIIGITSVKF
jgi:hypothetical protein